MRMILVLAIAVVPCVLGEIQITSPLNSIFRAGTDAHIEWISSGDANSLGGIDIVLMSGSATRLSLIGTIANNVPVDDGQYLWKIPDAFPPAKDYVLRLGAKQQFYYSTNFEITDESGPVYPDVLNAGGSSPKKPTATTTGTTASSITKTSVAPKPNSLSQSQDKPPAKAKSSAQQISPVNLGLALVFGGALLAV
ncbi:hypothetical protein K493DRAFT_338746 [Basidiobolus meristosporus CBS 931.73]|uniref:Yeast cell wall synthesis Kre9/Knh1-like N-terminal domain-containing protein n=1 Tax=Basidiobolus meristosporus CBS 931.73 TaxID=1314790 RepID=A0A1Y1Y3J5_9FUNG|nr:hypothetical protein K493DRAFT_338746 [Basidiobolus meristosporus CBS 931.73]|eukprot:ORX92591.1 hypothetical protein K493DRAFT_338746 [Basidiobolus meristosporus CBS 931.73]